MAPPPDPLPWRQWSVPVADFSYKEFMDETGMFPLPGHTTYFLITLTKLAPHSLASVFLSTRMYSGYAIPPSRETPDPQDS